MLPHVIGGQGDLTSRSHPLEDVDGDIGSVNVLGLLEQNMLDGG